MTFIWYYIPLALILGLFVAYAAMFGFDKFKDAFEKLKEYKKKKHPLPGFTAREGVFCCRSYCHFHCQNTDIIDKN